VFFFLPHFPGYSGKYLYIAMSESCTSPVNPFCVFDVGHECDTLEICSILHMWFNDLFSMLILKIIVMAELLQFNSHKQREFSGWHERLGESDAFVMVCLFLCLSQHKQF
jgi:hypothetical protein